MRSAVFVGMFLAAAVCAAFGDETAALRPVPFDRVKLHPGFWAQRVHTTIDATLPHCFKMCETETGRVRNWDRAAGKLDGAFEGYFFDDSDVYKVIEGAAYAYHHTRDAELLEHVERLIAKIAAMQQPDGYVNSYFTVNKSEPRWTNIEVRHELYCSGHLLEAAVAHVRCTNRRSLFDVAVKLADHIDSVFGPGRNMNPCGHPEIELALVRFSELFRTGDADASVAPDPQRAERYLRLARFFIDRHGRLDGREKLWGEYALDHKPLVEQREIVGHSVRAMYLLSGATDLARLSQEPEYAAALDGLWSDVTSRKLYVTGGLGSSAQNEGFTTAFDLPNDTAYAETCAAIGMVLWSHRMALLHADGRYIDALERSLYNGVLSGISLDGTKFFYVNPLASRGAHQRKPWYPCACCPPNLTRILPSIGGYAYAHSDDAIYLNAYMPSETTISLAAADGAPGVNVRVVQETDYPWDGGVTIRLEPSAPAAFALMLRVPAWCDDPGLTVGDQKIDGAVPENGYIALRGNWKGPETIRLDLSMQPRRVECDPRVKANFGRVAVQRGPLVYCAEAVDNGGHVRNLMLPRDSKLTAQPRADLLGGVTVITAAGGDCQRDEAESLYRLAPASQPTRELTLVPFYAWANREPGEMAVWLPETPTVIKLGPVAWLKPSASHCNPGDSPDALCDRQEPAGSGDHDIPRFTWWPRRGSTQWVQYDFDRPRTVRRVGVYWFDDRTSGGQCRVPASWKLLAREGAEWKPVAAASEPGTQPNMYNYMMPGAVKTDALRIEAVLQESFSGGILEWQVEAE